jgi:hypothetical protein
MTPRRSAVRGLRSAGSIVVVGSAAGVQLRECLAGTLAIRVERRDVVRAQKIQIAGDVVEVGQLPLARGARREVFADVVAFGWSQTAHHVAAEQDGLRAA